MHHQWSMHHRRLTIRRGLFLMASNGISGGESSKVESQDLPVAARIHSDVDSPDTLVGGYAIG